MKISEAISQAQELTGQVVSTARLVGWLSELDGKIAFDVFGADAWEPYADDDMSAELAIEYPWDGLYPHYLEAMIYYSNGEYDRYENAKTMFEKKYWDFRHFLRRTHPELKPCCRREAFPWP